MRDLAGADAEGERAKGPVRLRRNVQWYRGGLVIETLVPLSLRLKVLERE